MKTRWEATVNKDFLGAYSLDNGEQGYNALTVTIDRVQTGKIMTNKGEEVKTIAYLVGQKPMILNRTNMKELTRLFKSPYLEDWSGKSIVLEVKRVSAFGSMVDALRISQRLPTLPELTPTSPKWEGAKKAVESGSTTIETIKKHYSITPENEILLCTK
jgi:hypothetical protein